MDASRSYRTIWISDVHLGTRSSQAGLLLDFIKYNESEYLYVVGDLVDGWALRRGWYWPQQHNDVIQKLLRKARKGTRVTYVPGNHDEFARNFIDTSFGDITIVDQCIHETADGRRLLVLHGDQFDGVIGKAKWLIVFGAIGYGIALQLNRVFNAIRTRLGRPYWSLSKYLKEKSKQAVQYIADFETAVAREADRTHVDGIVCGHIHRAEIRSIEGVMYANCGDWVESCTALAERHDGTLEIIKWDAFESECARRDAAIERVVAGDGNIGTPSQLAVRIHS